MESFNLPIYYLDNKIPTSNHLITDLELVDTDVSNNLSGDSESKESKDIFRLFMKKY